MSDELERKYEVEIQSTEERQKMSREYNGAYIRTIAYDLLDAYARIY